LPIETVYDAPIVPVKVSGVTPVVTLTPFEVTVVDRPAMEASSKANDCMVMDAVVAAFDP
jgi:hypothetical protein